MDKYLKPARFDCDPNSPGSDKQFKHWLTTFKNFVGTINTASSASNTDAEAAPDTKLNTLINYISASVFEYIADATTYDAAIKTLTDIYVKPVNKIYARHKLATRKQGESEDLDAFIQDLHRLSKDCSFEAVSAEQHRQGHVRDAFISGIRSKDIRQKLLENVTLTMDQTFEKARTLHATYQNAESYGNSGNQFCASAAGVGETYESHVQVHPETFGGQDVQVAATGNQACWYCGYARHSNRSQCPAQNHKCELCGKLHHYEKVCRNSRRNVRPAATPRQPKSTPSQSAAIWPTLATLAPTPASPSKMDNHDKITAFCNIKINKKHVTRALIDTGSLSWSFIDKQLATRLGLVIIPSVDAPPVSMANSSLTTKVEGECHVDISLMNFEKETKYENVKLYVLGNLCSDVILGQDFMKQHKTVVFNFGGR